MRTFFVTVLTLVAFGFSAQAADMPRQPRPYQQPPVARTSVQPDDCDEKCEVYKNTRAHGLVQTRTELVCIPIKQEKPGIVVIRFYDAAGRELDAGNKQHSNLKDTVDKFCVGRHYLMKARAGHVEVCNDVDTKLLAPEQIAILLRSGMPPNHWLYLFAGRSH